MSTKYTIIAYTREEYMNMAKRKLLKSIPLETKNIVLEYLETYGATPVKTPDLYNQIGNNYRKLEDIFKYLEEVENLLVKEKRGKPFVWRLKDKALLTEKISQKDATNLDYAIELNKDDFDEGTIKTLKKMFQSNSKNIVGFFAISEDFKDKKMNDFYNTLTEAIEKKLYLNLEFVSFKLQDVKPIKLIFIDNNWYLALEHYDEEKNKNIFSLNRLAFLKNIIILKDYDYSDKHSFQKSSIDKYLEFLPTIQSSLTLFDEEIQTATIKATPEIAKYFKKDMKKFLSSQKFEENQKDGSVIFTLEYTQPLEILPFIQKWMPDLIILSPKELKDEYIKKLEKTIKNLKEQK